MASYNKCTFLGNVTRDPELKYLPSGVAVCDFGIAVNKKLGKDKPDRVLFLDVTIFERKAEVAAEYLRKGSQVLVEGELVLDQWTDKTTGDKRSRHKLNGFDFQMLGSPRGAGNDAGGSQVTKTVDEYPQAASKTDDADIPFSFIGFIVGTALAGGAMWLT